MKTTTCEVKNTLDGINGRLDNAEKKASELEHKAVERNQNEIMHSIPLDNEMVLQGINGKTNKNVENQLCNELQWNKFSF